KYCKNVKAVSEAVESLATTKKGFYSNFEFPSTEQSKSEYIDLDFDNPEPFAGVEVVTPERPGANFWEHCFLPNVRAIRSTFGARQNPDLWITGHSLGAAVATLFSSFVVWSARDNGIHTTVPNLPWDKLFNIRGAYTFGTPQVGDQDFKDAISSAIQKRRSPPFQFYRVINASDVVCTVPATAVAQAVGNFLYEQKGRHFLRRKLGFPPKPMESQPTGVTLLDFKHVGDPVLLGLRDGSIQSTERRFFHVAGVWLNQVPHGLNELVFNPYGNCDTWLSKAMVAANVMTFGGFGLLKDHYPSEYLTNLKVAQKKNPDGPSRSHK
ncbi:hypothetical protein HK405_010835, partial [Cladochytrium tenue]